MKGRRGEREDSGTGGKKRKIFPLYDLPLFFVFSFNYVSALINLGNNTSRQVLYCSDLNLTFADCIFFFFFFFFSSTLD